jgi:ABC-type Fe3+-hydroxamate transport system substrate-binding protein
MIGQSSTVRIVSLVPSSTETLLALGGDVVACSRFCEQPHIQQVGGTKNPDIEAIVSLAPDLVVLDREENRIEDHDALVTAGLDVFVSDVTDLAGAVAVVRDLAARVGATVPDEVGALPPAADPIHRRTAFVPIWRRPWMTISSVTYGADVLAHLGVDLVPVADPAAYPTVDLDAIAASRPDLVVVPSEPYDFAAQHLAELHDAVPDAHLVEIDGQDLFWWGVRTPGALSRLAGALVPRPTP